MVEKMPSSDVLALNINVSVWEKSNIVRKKYGDESLSWPLETILRPLR